MQSTITTPVLTGIVYEPPAAGVPHIAALFDSYGTLLAAKAYPTYDEAFRRLEAFLQTINKLKGDEGEVFRQNY